MVMVMLLVVVVVMLVVSASRGSAVFRGGECVGLRGGAVFRGCSVRRRRRRRRRSQSDGIYRTAVRASPGNQR